MDTNYHIVDGKPRLVVTPRSNPELVMIVRGIVSGQIMTSAQIPMDMWRMVFLPLALGGLSPPEELTTELVRPRPTEPEKVPLAYNRTFEGSPPEPVPAPALVPYDDNLRLAAKFGDVPEEDWFEHKKVVDEQNNMTGREYLAATRVYGRNRKAWETEAEKADIAFDAAVKDNENFNEARMKSYEEDLGRWEEETREVFSEWLDDVGLIYGDLAMAAPRSINGYPMFFSMSLLNKGDWERVRVAVEEEIKRAEEMEV